MARISVKTNSARFPHESAAECFAADCGACAPNSESKRERPEGREGIVTVYDHNDDYLGCMGIAVWRELLEKNNLDRVYDGL
jgi:hypothetical protein